MRIVIFEVEPWERPAFDPLLADHEVTFTEEPLTAENAAAYRDAEIISVFIYSAPDRAVLEQFKDLRLVSTRSTGYDHIDLDACDEAGIMVCNVPSYGEHTVAEHVFGLLLTISHNLWNAIDRTRKGDFSLEGLRGFDLMGKTMGVVGTGAIGRHVVRIARGFGMHVLATDLHEDEAFAREYDFRYVPLNDLLSHSDVISLNVPLNDRTKHMIGAEQFDLMKDHVVIINTSRGALIDIKAMVAALADGTIGAAGLDVLPAEPVIREEAELLRSAFRAEHDLETLLADHILLRLRNVYITPHSAFDTEEAVRRILEVTVENIQGFLADSPVHVVNEAVPEQRVS